MLDVDLKLLRDDRRFEQMCFRLARYEFQGVMTLAQTWDGGRDVVSFNDRGGDVVFQCKFTDDLAAAKPKILASLDSLRRNGRQISSWILCVPIDPSGVFMDWLRGEVEGRGMAGTVWGRSELLARLEQHRDVLETFFYGVYAELALLFRTEHLELFQLKLDPACEWQQPDGEVLSFGRRGNVRSPDLLLDIIVRNEGAVGTALTRIEAEIFDQRPKLHGIPGTGLLFSQVTYVISIGGGKPGVYSSQCEPPVLVKAGELERFKVRVTDTGYAWNGALQLSLVAGPREKLHLPTMRLWT